MLRGLLPKSARSALLKLLRSLQPRYRTFQGMRLPPQHLRYGEVEFKEDAMFLKSAQDEVQRLRSQGALNSKSRVLDVGCGSGRFLTGILSEWGVIGHYSGLDVVQEPILWANRYLAANLENVEFLCIDVQNERYNPDGQPLDAALRFPFADASFDLVYVYSVFCHFVGDEVAHYLREFARVLADDGSVFVTAYVEPDVPPLTINPENYIQTWTQTRHCVRYSRRHFLDLVDQAQFEVAHEEHRSEYDGESAFVLTKRPLRQES